MAWFSLLVLVTYMMLVITIIPKSAFEFDMYKLKIRLLPFQSKLISVCLLLLIFSTSLIFKNQIENLDQFLISGINLSLFIFLFSKQRYEDEYIEQIRFKSFAYSFISFLSFVLGFSTIGIGNPDSQYIINNLILNVFIGSSMFISLLYFYITLYKTKK